MPDLSSKPVLLGAVVLFAALTPSIFVRYISGRSLDSARDVWLFVLAVLGTVSTLCWVSVPLGLMGAAVLLHWKSWRALPAVLTWLAIIATWILIQAVPHELLPVITTGWRIVTASLLCMGCLQRWYGQEVKATLGSRILLAALLVLVWPFTTPWEWPLYAIGLWLTSSWIACAALLVAIIVRFPEAGPVTVTVGLLIVALFAIPTTRVALIDRTPRGSSLDGLRMRYRTWAAMIRVTAHWPTWLIGWGPTPADRLGPSLEAALEREAVCQSVRANYPLATWPTHCEPLQLACQYGVLSVVAMLWFAAQLVGHLARADPWSASALAGVVLSSFTIPTQAAPVGLVWLIVLAVVMGR
jgi:hypothetical protein